MTKKAFGSHANLAHAWASMSYAEGYSGDKRMFFDWRTIYSYRSNYPIALILPGNIVALNSDSYSVSTSKHKRIAFAAVSHMQQWLRFTVGELREIENMSNASYIGKDVTSPEAWPKEHKAKLWASVQERTGLRVAELLGKAKRARKEAYKGFYASDADSAFKNMLKVGQYLGFDVSSLTQSELAQAAQAALDSAKQAHKAEAKAQAAKEAEQRRIILEADFPSFWRAHKHCSTMYKGQERAITATMWHSVGGHTLLRRSASGNDCETSRGAEVPWLEALKLYTFATRVKGKGYQPPPDVKVGPYSLTSINPAGDVIIGCHVLFYDEMQLLAEREQVSI